MKNEKIELELKPCPFCGEKAELRRTFKGFSGKNTIIDEWQVTCKNQRCQVHTSCFSGEIYHADNGAIVIAHNGAIEAMEAWNKRV